MKKKLSLFLLFVSVSLTIFSQSRQEKRIGAITLKTIKETEGLYENSAVLQVVKEVGLSLEKQLQLGYPLKYFLVDTEEPNAFATAGGYVFVTRGLLSILDNKDELAGILAHELTHVSEHHATKTLTINMVPAVLKLPGTIIGLLTSNDIAQLVNYPIDQVSKIGTAAFSRDQEKVADTKGVLLAIKSRV